MDEKVFLPGTIGERIKDLRTARGISTKELSDKAGLDYSTISRIENGKIQKVADDIVSGYESGSMFQRGCEKR